MHDSCSHKVRDIRLLLTAGKPAVAHDALGGDDHALGSTGEQHVLIQRAFKDCVALCICRLRMDNGEVRPNSLHRRQRFARKGVRHIGKVIVDLPKVADLQPAHRHERDAVTGGAQGGNDGIAGVLVSANQPLLHRDAVALRQPVLAFVADKTRVHNAGAAAQTQRVHIHRARRLDDAQVFPSLTDQLEDGRHGRAVERVAAQPHAVSVANEGNRFGERTEFVHMHLT